MAADYSKIIADHYTTLLRAIDPTTNLINLMRWPIGNVMSKNEAEKILAEPSTDEKIQSLLRFPIDAEEEDQKEARIAAFREALRVTGQEHIANLLDASSVHLPDKLPMSEEHWQALDGKLVNISKILDCECDIVETLASINVFTTTDCEKVSACSTCDAKAGEIVKIIMRKSDAAYSNFIDALQKVGQEQVIYVLSGDGTVGKPPVRDVFLKNMRKERVSILDCMEPKISGLLDMLVSGGVINDREYDMIGPLSTLGLQPVSNSDMNIALLRSPQRRPQESFDKFIVALIATQQNKVAQLIVGEEINGKIIITFNDQSDETQVKKTYEELTFELRKLSEDGVDSRESDLKRVLCANDITISYVKQGSIEIGFRCSTVVAVRYLREMYTNGDLDRLLNDAYFPLFSTEGLVSSIKFSIAVEEFDRCATNFDRNPLMTPAHRRALLFAAKTIVVTDAMTDADPIGSRSTTELATENERRVTQKQQQQQQQQQQQFINELMKITAEAHRLILVCTEEKNELNQRVLAARRREEEMSITANELRQNLRRTTEEVHWLRSVKMQAEYRLDVALQQLHQLQNSFQQIPPPIQPGLSSKYDGADMWTAEEGPQHACYHARIPPPPVTDDRRNQWNYRPYDQYVNTSLNRLPQFSENVQFRGYGSVPTGEYHDRFEMMPGCSQELNRDHIQLRTGVIPEGVATVPFNHLSGVTQIAEGSFGIICRASHIDWGTVAYKKLRISVINPNDRGRLQRQVQTECLRHQNIVANLGVVFEPGEYGIVMEFAAFGGLGSFIEKYSVELIMKMSIANGIVHGMNYLHTKDPPVIHGNFKMQKVLVADGYVAKICDFGLSKWKLYSTTKTGSRPRRGTVTNIPPENWNNINLSRTTKCDVYAFGILMYELLSEKPAFEYAGGNADQIKVAVFEGIRPDINDIAADESDSEVTIKMVKKDIERFWAHDPDKRPTFGEVASYFSYYMATYEDRLAIAKANLDAEIQQSLS